MARLSPEKWEEVKAAYCVGKRTLEDIGVEFGVSHAAISQRSRKEEWQKLDDEGEKLEVPVKAQPSSFGFIYIITCVDSSGAKFYKIGMAKNIEPRISTLQTGNPFKLKIELCFYVANMTYVEKIIHREYSNKRIDGEWFSLSDDDVIDIAKRYSVNG